MTTPSGLLTVPVITGRTPASPNGAIPGNAGLVTTLHAQLTDEYVAGSSFAMYAQYLKSLPWAFDQLSADFGDDIYSRMQLDSQVSADINVLKSSILEDGLTLTSAVEDKLADGYDLARTISDTISKNLEHLEISIDDVLWNLLDAIALGSRVAELNYDYDAILGKRGLWLTSVKVKPRRATAFLVDAYNNVLGLLAQMPTGFSPVQIGSVLTDLKYQPNLIAREKFAILTFRPVDSDPRGTSILTPAYRSWWLKQQVIGEYLKYLTQFASPTVLGFTDPAAQRQPAVDAAGNVVLDVNGNPTYIDPEQVMFNALTQWRNGSVGVFRGNAKVQLVQSAGDGKAFIEAIDGWNRDISKAILSQTLATEEGRHQARAAAEVHQDVLETVVRQAKNSVTRMLIRDVFAPLVKYNWGEVAVDLVPKVSFGISEQKDFTKEATAIAALYTSGYIGESQKPGIDERLGLPERDTQADDAAAMATQPIAPTAPVAAVAVDANQPPMKPVAITPTHAVEAKAA